MIKKLLSLEEIITGCKKNESACKEMLYKTFYGYLMAVTLRYVKNDHEREEIVNDSFIKIFSKINTFQTSKNELELHKTFRGWIGKISSRTALDKLRRRTNISYFDDLSETDHPVNEISTASELHVQDILNLLKGLPEIHQLVFNLFVIEGFSHEEISKLIDIPENSSRVYLTRAKNKLRVLYKNTMANLPNIDG